MARLTKPQARIIGGNKPGEKLFSNPRINTNQRSIDTLVKHGHLKVTDRLANGFNEYTVQDTPEVRACNVERDAAYAAIMADAAIAPVSVATDAAPAWTPAVGDIVAVKRTNEEYPIALIDPQDGDYFMLDEGMIDEDGDVAGGWHFTNTVTLIERATPERAAKYSSLRMPEREYGEDPAPDAAQTAAAVSDADIRAYLTEIKQTDERRLYYEIAEQQPAHKEACRRGCVRPTISGYYVVTGMGEDWLTPMTADRLPMLTPADLPPFAPSETDYANTMKLIDQQAAELEAVKQMFDGYQAAAIETERQQTATISRLTSACDKLQAERDAAKAEAVDATDDLQQYRGWINDLIDDLDHISPIEALTRLLSFRRTYEADRARFADDAAPMIAALRKRDNGNRTPAADVLAMFGDDDEGTIA